MSKPKKNRNWNLCSQHPGEFVWFSCCSQWLVFLWAACLLLWLPPNNHASTRTRVKKKAAATPHRKVTVGPHESTPPAGTSCARARVCGSSALPCAPPPCKQKRRAHVLEAGCAHMLKFCAQATPSPPVPPTPACRGRKAAAQRGPVCCGRDLGAAVLCFRSFVRAPAWRSRPQLRCMRCPTCRRRKPCASLSLPPPAPCTRYLPTAPTQLHLPCRRVGLTLARHTRECPAGQCSEAPPMHPFPQQPACTTCRQRATSVCTALLAGCRWACPRVIALA